jgi:hypothetical protein
MGPSILHPCYQTSNSSMLHALECLRPGCSSSSRIVVFKRLKHCAVLLLHYNPLQPLSCLLGAWCSWCTWLAHALHHLLHGLHTAATCPTGACHTQPQGDVLLLPCRLVTCSASICALTAIVSWSAKYVCHAKLVLAADFTACRRAAAMPTYACTSLRAEVMVCSIHAFASHVALLCCCTD